MFTSNSNNANIFVTISGNIILFKYQVFEFLENNVVIFMMYYAWFKNWKTKLIIKNVMVTYCWFLILNDFSSMKLCSGAFHIGPFKKQTSESNTQSLSSAIIWEKKNRRMMKSVYYECVTHNPIFVCISIQGLPWQALS